MEFLADLHLHSRFARATSKELTLPNIANWARTKGIDLVGIPDFTHPVWLKEVEKQIEPYKESGGKESGFYILSELGETSPKLVFSTEISAIFSRNGNSYRIHLLVISPSLEVAKEINKALRKLGRLDADGRPIFGKDIILIAKTLFDVSPVVILIPAHIWTPWFSLFGSRSGFDSLEVAFGEYAERIPAVETGLSSDPAMNWRVSQLDKKAIVSFSDAHSLTKLGRELTRFEGDLCWKTLRDMKVTGTIEFYPEEGKYYQTGHRKCGVSHSPKETAKYGTACPICGKNLTVGVMQRVEELADRSVKDLKLKSVHGWVLSSKRPPFLRLVPLAEVIAQAVGLKTPTAKTVTSIYSELCKVFKTEWEVLTKAPLDAIVEVSGDAVADAIYKNRVGEVKITPGYDGLYGKVRIEGVKSPARRKSKTKSKDLSQSRLF